MTIKGFATEPGTKTYRDRFSESMADDHFKQQNGRWHSSLGLGTYLGDPLPEVDRAYKQAVKQGIENGCNVIDTAINYRYQRSERAVGEALAHLIENRAIQRNEIIISTKGGYVPFDGRPPENPREYVNEHFFEPGIIEPDELVNGSHCMSPGFLEHQLETSLDNLNLETVDTYYVHNPESQLSTLDPEQFYDRLERVFARLEEAIENQAIRAYGLATWKGFRVPRDDRAFLDLERIVNRAENAGGEDHGFEAIQFPFNLAMTDAITEANQTGGHLLEVARHHDLTMTSSASLMQGSLAERLPDEFRQELSKFDTDAQRALQFSRCAPGLTTALVGMKSGEHVAENLEVCETEKIKPGEYLDRFFVREE